MANLTKVSPNVEPRSAMRGLILEGDLFAGEALTAGDCVRIHSDGKVMKGSAAVKNTRTIETGDVDFAEDIAVFDGMVNEAYAAGEPVEIFGLGCIFNYGTALTPGAFYWLSGAGSEGLLSDVAVATGDSAVAKALSTTDIRIIR